MDHILWSSELPHIDWVVNLKGESVTQCSLLPLSPHQMREYLLEYSLWSFQWLVKLCLNRILAKRILLEQMKHDFLDLSCFQAAEHPEKSQTKQTLITEDLVSGFTWTWNVLVSLQARWRLQTLLFSSSIKILCSQGDFMFSDTRLHSVCTQLKTN